MKQIAPFFQDLMRLLELFARLLANSSWTISPTIPAMMNVTSFQIVEAAMSLTSSPFLATQWTTAIMCYQQPIPFNVWVTGHQIFQAKDLPSSSQNLITNVL